MTYDEAIDYIHSVSWLGSRPGLERIRELCSLMGDPQDSLQFIHVAGTNGKGSFTSMLSSVLLSAGKCVGTFTSPYVYTFNERFSVNGEPITDSELADFVEYVKPFAGSMAESPTEFELITAIGFEFFKRKKCDIVILEAGMGGRLDSTNIISESVLSVICGVALDHTEYLGNTTAAIATEKAGIIKRGCPVVCGRLDSSATSVIQNKAAGLDSPVTLCNYDRLDGVNFSLEGSSFCVEGYSKPFDLSLLGTYQPENALLVITAAELLGIAEEHIRAGLMAAVWHARFEVLCHDPVIVFDGGHNPQGVEAAVRSAVSVFHNKAVVVTGVMADKDYAIMAETISKIAAFVYCTEPSNARVLPASDYAEVFEGYGVPAEAIPDVAVAVRTAKAMAQSAGLPVLILGSLYMYRQVRDALDEI